MSTAKDSKLSATSTLTAVWTERDIAEMAPGQIIPAKGSIELNVGRSTQVIIVANLGDRPIQVGSHYHFFEVNNALDFPREATRGYRLNIAAGTAVRFEPGQTREVELVAYSGSQEVYGFQGKVMGKLVGKLNPTA